jgi:hypothetical protein
MLPLEDSVTITDPRHPLFQRTLPLLGLVNRRDLGPCCIVLVEGMSRQYIPVRVTDRSATPLSAWPLPLDVTSVRELVVTDQRIVGRMDHEPVTSDLSGQATLASAIGQCTEPESNLDAVDRRPASARAAGTEPSVSCACQASDGSGGAA